MFYHIERLMSGLSKQVSFTKPKLNITPYGGFGKSKGGCAKCTIGSVIIIGIVIGIIICVIIGVMDSAKDKHLSCVSACGGVPASINATVMVPTHSTPISKAAEATEPAEKKESFIRSLSNIYARSKRPNPLLPFECRTRREFDDTHKHVNDLKKAFHKDISEMNETFDNEMTYGGTEEDKTVEPRIRNEQEDNTFDIQKSSESGLNDAAMRMAQGESYRRCKILPIQPQPKLPPSTQPVKGISTANGRLNNLMMSSLVIDDKGEVISQGGCKPIESFSPTIANNSRLSGSSIDMGPITGACFKKYDTDTFFENNTPLPPKLNICKGEPLKLRYNANETM